MLRSGLRQGCRHVLLNQKPKLSHAATQHFVLNKCVGSLGSQNLRCINSGSINSDHSAGSEFTNADYYADVDYYTRKLKTSSYQNSIPLVNRLLLLVPNFNSHQLSQLALCLGTLPMKIHKSRMMYTVIVDRAIEIFPSTPQMHRIQLLRAFAYLNIRSETFLSLMMLNPECAHSSSISSIQNNPNTVTAAAACHLLEAMAKLDFRCDSLVINVSRQLLPHVNTLPIHELYFLAYHIAILQLHQWEAWKRDGEEQKERNEFKRREGGEQAELLLPLQLIAAIIHK